MKIATYNINNVNVRLPVLLDWLTRAMPDIVCLQELKSLDRDFPEGEISRAGYSAVWSGQKTWNGVAILARDATPIVTRKGLPGDPSDTQSRYIEAAVDGLVVGCLYAPNGNPQPGPKFQYKLSWMARLARHARKLLKSGAPVVLAGDYNVVPTPFDIYPTKSWNDDALVQPESRAALKKIVDQGWIDALRQCHPKEPMYTFWHYWRNSWKRNAGLRIDHLLLSPAAALRLQDAGVDTAIRGVEGASDHAPAWITLSARASRAQGRRPARRVTKKRAPRKA
jgi:exodeoxyribonuclease-3